MTGPEKAHGYDIGVGICPVNLSQLYPSLYKALPPKYAPIERTRRLAREITPPRLNRGN